MQVLILAAGMGKRLQPLTNKIPKALVEVNGRPLLINALECLSGRGINEVLIVVGDKKDKIINFIGFQYKEMRIIYIDNPLYNKSNNIFSFYLAANYVCDDLILLECDLFYYRSLIDTLLEGNADCNVLVSKYDASLMDGTIVKVDDQNRIRSLIVKKNQEIDLDYSSYSKTVNAYFFKKEFVLEKLFPAITLYVKSQDINSYYELVLGSLIYYGSEDIQAIFIDSSQWGEIDNFDDLNRIEEKYSENK